MGSDSVDAVQTESEETGIGVREVAAASAAGLAGTIAMSPLLLAAWALGALNPDAFAGLSEIVGLGGNLVVGIAIFVVGGMTALPLLFISLAAFLPGDTLAQRGVSYATIVWVGFVFGFYRGDLTDLYAGQISAEFVIFAALTLVAHWVYGYVLGAIYGRYADVIVYDI
ncbi:DUF6789 family protein [Halegenticoccus tardaugens]|uniref:DUF6789 family protein n=1 Tax=Halegenticoccus tardaugens TaxID=2071624 RepID=UPI00100C1BD8|nr:DUF6789 family protein [Halegenticoccus tardaugens]